MRSDRVPSFAHGDGECKNEKKKLKKKKQKTTKSENKLVRYYRFDFNVQLSTVLNTFKFQLTRTFDLTRRSAEWISICVNCVACVGVCLCVRNTLSNKESNYDLRENSIIEKYAKITTNVFGLVPFWVFVILLHLVCSSDKFTQNLDSFLCSAVVDLMWYSAKRFAILQFCNRKSKKIYRRDCENLPWSPWHAQKSTVNCALWNIEQYNETKQDTQKMDFSGTNSLNMKPFLGGYPFQGKNMHFQYN